MKIIELDRYYFITCNGKKMGKNLWMQEHTAINYARNLAKEYSGKNLMGEFNPRVFEVRYFDVMKCKSVFNIKNQLKNK